MGSSQRSLTVAILLGAAIGCSLPMIAHGVCPVTTWDGNSNGSACVFPFQFNDTSYDYCYADDWVFRTPWCSTTANFDEDGLWGYCTPCVDSCEGQADCDYPSCQGCHVYASCSGGVLYDNRPCPAGLVWDDRLKICNYHSTTCREKTTGNTRWTVLN